MKIAITSPEGGNHTERREVYDDQAVDTDYFNTHQNRRADHQQREENKVVEDAIANRFAEK